MSQSLRVKIWRIFILKNLNKLLLAAPLFTKPGSTACLIWQIFTLPDATAKAFVPHPVTEPRIIRLLGECVNHYNNAFQNVFVYLHCILQVDKMTVKFDLTVLISRVSFHQCGGQQQVRKYKVI